MTTKQMPDYKNMTKAQLACEMAEVMADSIMPILDMVVRYRLKLCAAEIVKNIEACYKCDGTGKVKS